MQELMQPPIAPMAIAAIGKTNFSFARQDSFRLFIETDFA